VATYSTGITATWGGTPFAEVYEVGIPLYGSVRKDRTTNVDSEGWTDEVGTVSVVAYASTNITTAEYGKRKQLSVSGGGLNLTKQAVCTGVSATPELNGVTRYTFTAQLLDG
jgi:hypothetical protein